MERESATDKTILKVLWLFKQEEAMFFGHYTIFPKYWLQPVVISLLQVHFVVWHIPRSTTHCDLKSLWHIPHGLAGSCAFSSIICVIALKLWANYKALQVIPLFLWCFLFSSSLLLFLVVGCIFTCHGISSIIFWFFSSLVISFPNNWSIYLAMPNILLPSCLPRLPCHGGQP